MSLRSMKNITRRSWDMILITDTVIDRVKLLVKYQPELSVFTDYKGWLIGDGDVEITGVGGDLNDSPILKIDNKNDNLGDQEYQ